MNKRNLGTFLRGTDPTVNATAPKCSLSAAFRDTYGHGLAGSMLVVCILVSDVLFAVEREGEGARC